MANEWVKVPFWAIILDVFIRTLFAGYSQVPVKFTPQFVVVSNFCTSISFIFALGTTCNPFQVQPTFF